MRRGFYSDEAKRIGMTFFLFGIGWSIITFYFLDDATLGEMTTKFQFLNRLLFVFFSTLLIIYITSVFIRRHEEAVTVIKAKSKENKKNARLLNKMAYEDSMTGLLNMSGLSKRFEEIELANYNGKYAIVYMDIDNFRHINETMGHNVGDRLLKIISHRIGKHSEDENLLCRLSGDTFIVVDFFCEEEKFFIKKYEHLQAAILEPIVIDDAEYQVSISIGIAKYPAHGQDVNDLIRYGDLALSRVKRSGKGKIEIYETEMSDKIARYVTLTKEIRVAIKENDFILHYQPIIDQETMELIAVEALIRWEHPEKGLIYPDYFIQVAEESGLIYDIGEWVLKEACQQHRKWIDLGFGPVKISINVSGARLLHSNMIKHLSETIQNEGVNQRYIQLEITETAVLNNVETAMGQLNKLRNLGVSIALDDFGTGYSSLSHLTQFPIDVLKLDKSFIQRIMSDKIDEAIKGVTVLDEERRAKSIINALLSIAKDMGMYVVAEGVETSEQRDYILQCGCLLAQGYLYSKPLPAEGIERNYLKKILTPECV